jgi:hypothetical protein
MPEYRFAFGHFSAGGTGCTGPGSDTLRPAANGAWNELIANGCGVTWQCVSEAVADDDGSRAESNGTAWTTSTFALSDPSDTMCTITSVSLVYRARRHVKDAESIGLIRIGGSDYSGPTETLTDNYQTYSIVWANNPATGNPWSWADLIGLEAGVSLQTSKATHEARCTQVMIVVDFSS